MRTIVNHRLIAYFKVLRRQPEILEAQDRATDGKAEVSVGFARVVAGLTVSQRSLLDLLSGPAFPAQMLAQHLNIEPG